MDKDLTIAKQYHQWYHAIADGDKEGITISRYDKFEQKLRSHPVPKDIRFEAFVKFLEKNNFQYFSNNGADYVYLNIILDFKFNVAKPHGPGQKCVKPIYILNALKIIDQVRVLEGAEVYDND